MPKRPPLSNLGLSQHVATKGEPAGKARSAAKKGGAGKGGAKQTHFLQTRLNREGWRELKMLAVGENRPLQSLCVEALNDLLRKYRKAPVVEGPAEA